MSAKLTTLPEHISKVEIFIALYAAKMTSMTVYHGYWNWMKIAFVALSNSWQRAPTVPFAQREYWRVN